MNKKSRLHIPRPTARPGEKPDFSYLDLSPAGSVDKPAIDARTRDIEWLSTGLVRVLDDEHKAVGPWVPDLDAGKLQIDCHDTRFGEATYLPELARRLSTLAELESRFAERLESELAMIRYISWAIPSIGFIGTVRGIGEALAQADKAVQGDIAGVTQSLGVAFNSTFIALLISIFLMFLVHQLQLVQERLVFDSETYCDDKVIRHLKAD